MHYNETTFRLNIIPRNVSKRCKHVMHSSDYRYHRHSLCTINNNGVCDIN